MLLNYNYLLDVGFYLENAIDRQGDSRHSVGE